MQANEQRLLFLVFLARLRGHDPNIQQKCGLETFGHMVELVFSIVRPESRRWRRTGTLPARKTRKFCVMRALAMYHCAIKSPAQGSQWQADCTLDYEGQGALMAVA
jgi:hypothetical protein